MEPFQACRLEAEKKIRTTDHLITQTYPMLQEPKMLLVGLKSMHEAQIQIINSILEYEILFNRAKNPSTKEEKIIEFKKHSKRLALEKYTQLIQETKEILDIQKTSPVEFFRQNSLVICDNDYKITKITEEIVKKTLIQTKEFLTESKKIINEQIFK